MTFARCQASETAFYWLITTRRAVSPGFDRASNVERDDARDLARALSNPGRTVWSGRRIMRSAVEMLLQASLTGTWERGSTRTSACQRLCKCSSGGNVQRRTVPGLIAITSHQYYAEMFHIILSYASAL